MDLNHSLSVVHPGAQIGSGVVIGPFAVIEDDVVIGEGTWIGPHVTIMSGSRIGRNCRVFPGAVIGAIPQDLKYKGEYSTVEVGDNVTIRECCTLNKGTAASDRTVVGNDALLMAYVHVAHDCIVGDHVILANSVSLAGHVEVGDHAVIGGLSGVHQFVKVGAHVMVGGGTIVRKDVPPYIKVARDPVSFAGVNTLGLKRRGYSSDRIHRIQDIYRLLFMRGLNFSQAIDAIEETIPGGQEKDLVLGFLRNADRGIVSGLRQANGSRTHGTIS